MDFNLWREPDEKATFTFRLRPRLIQSGIGVKLLCCVSGKPAPKIEWYKESKLITETDPHYNIEHECGVCILEIASCTLSDAGNFSCRAENALGSDETKCHVTIEECKYKKLKDLLSEQETKHLRSAQESPSFDRRLVNYKLVSVGETAAFKVSFTGNPAPSIQWLKNGETLTAGKAITIVSNESESQLVIASAQLSDEGEYSCKISNHHGIAITKCQLELEKPRVIKQLTPEKEVKKSVIKSKKVVESRKVVERSEKIEKVESSSTKITSVVSSSSSSNGSVTTTKSESKSETLTETKSESVPLKAGESSKAHFSKHIKSQNLLEGEPLVLDCEVESKGAYDIVWLRNGKEIPENPDFLREKSNNQFKLTVNEIFPEDSGVFSAELLAEGASKARLSSCSVVVRGREEAELDPRFDVFPTNLNVDEGSPVKIDCKVVGTQPITVKWFKDNQQLAESNRIQLLSNQDGTYSLSIPTVLSTDDGLYTASASNSNGEVIAAFSLSVSFDATVSNSLDVKKLLEKTSE